MKLGRQVRLSSTWTGRVAKPFSFARLYGCLSFCALSVASAQRSDAESSRELRPSNERASGATALIVSVGDAASGQFISDAQVRLPSIGRVVRTKWNGEALFTDLAEGRYRLQVRAIGYAPADFEVQLRGDSVGVFCQLERLAAPLDTVHVTDLYASPPPRDFEVRRRMGIGRFITDSTLSHDPVQSLPVLLASHIPGIMVNGRGVFTLEGSGLLGSFSSACGILIYLDGFKLAEPDLESIRPADLIGVEVYRRASAPVQFRPQGSYCQVVLLWSKW
jgi:hypothetical protein